ncbi:MAG: hypothetical protein WC610_04555 [Patescibacteria group bacterium]
MKSVLNLYLNPERSGKMWELLGMIFGGLGALFFAAGAISYFSNGHWIYGCLAIVCAVICAKICNEALESPDSGPPEML